MDSDIILEGSKVKLEANDLVLDFASRRKNTQGERRALVHDFDDGLTINWAGDYPGGVRIQGHVLLDHTVYVKNTATFEHAPLVPDLQIKGLPRTIIKGGGDPTIPSGGKPGQKLEIPGSLVTIIKDLRKQIDQLETKVAALERR